MKKLIFSIVVFCLVVVVSLSANNFNQGVQKINDGLYVGKQGDLYFALERVTDKNINFWQQYARNQMSKVIKGDSVKQGGRSSAIGGFSGALEYYNVSDVWVGYSTGKKVCDQAQKTLQKEGDIEMVVTATTDKNLNFYMPMGIFRAIGFLGSQHKNVSMQLHSFVAKSMGTIYGNKDYLMTKPMFVMRQIMQENLPEDSLWTDDIDFEKALFDYIKVGKIITVKNLFNKDKVQFEMPKFFEQTSISFAFAPMVIVDIRALFDFMQLDIIKDLC